MMCRHCQTGVVSRPRGLCWNCFYAPGVRELYPRKTTQPIPEIKPKREPDATSVPPGPAKVAVLARRYERREFLFHPDDAEIEL